MIGPFPDPLMGMSVANQVLFNSLKSRQYRVDRVNTAMYAFDERPGAFSVGKLLHFLKPNIYLYKVLRASAVYVTPGQTFFGVSKYSLFFLVSRLFRKDLILHIHSNVIREEYEGNKGFKKWYMGFLLKRATKAIVLSPSHVHNMEPFLAKDKIFSVVNFVQPEYIIPSHEVNKKDMAGKRIIFLSNLMTGKGILYLLEALKDIAESNVSFEARLAGDMDGTIKDEVSAYVDALPNVTYLGVVRGTEKKALLDWGNLFVFPSYLTEGLPLSILEAMGTGNMVIATRHPSLEDLFEDGSIRYIEKQSAGSIREALEADYSKTLEVRQENHRFVSRRCSVDKFTDSVVNVIFGDASNDHDEG